MPPKKNKSKDTSATKAPAKAPETGGTGGAPASAVSRLDRGKPGDLKADLQWRASQGDLYARRILVEHGIAEPTEHEAGQGIVARTE